MGALQEMLRRVEIPGEALLERQPVACSAVEAGGSTGLFAGCAVSVALQRVQFLTGLEPYRLTGRDAHLGAGAGVPANAGLASTNAEYPKAAELDALSGSQGLFQPLENGIHGRLRLGAGKAGALNHVMYDVLLDQRGTSLPVLKP